MRTRTEIFLIFAAAAVGYAAVTFLGASVTSLRYTLARSEGEVPDAGSVAQVQPFDVNAWSTTLAAGAGGGTANGGNVNLIASGGAIYAPLDLPPAARPSSIAIGAGRPIVLREDGVVIGGERISSDGGPYRRLLAWLVGSRPWQIHEVGRGPLFVRGGAASHLPGDVAVVRDGQVRFIASDGTVLLAVDDECRGADGRTLSPRAAFALLEHWIDAANAWRFGVDSDGGRL